MSDTDSSKNRNDEEWKDKLEKELAVWKDSLHRENAMLEKIISSFEELEEKMKKKEGEKPGPSSPSES